MAKSKFLTWGISIDGVVQGVGFRPFIKNLADEMGISGFVKNNGGSVYIEAAVSDYEPLLQSIKDRAPEGSAAMRFSVTPLPYVYEEKGFQIKKSDETKQGLKMPSPDLALCGDCKKELFEEGNPRYLNPFISCAHCGPRYSIMRALPYDRENTSMAAFPMCAFCESQYSNPTDRRYHAQTVCCNACGPKLKGLKSGGIFAVKGIGGYHLTCSPYDEKAVMRLREIKGREHKPFAVMFENMQSLNAHAEVTAAEEALLLSAAAPIVLVKRKKSGVVSAVYHQSPYLGAFLPYTPLQHLLLRETGPLVMTSANLSSMPIIISDEEMAAFEGIDGVISHNRDILRRLDDSVLQVVNGKTQFLRRARGVVPLPIPMDRDDIEVAAYGAQEKNTFCLSAKGYAYLSQENGDLDTVETETVFKENMADMTTLLAIMPKIAACDMHPGYVTREWATHAPSFPMAVLVQHHHAHIASVMAEHNIKDEVLGIAFDGTGYGEDHTIWGGEFLLCTPADFKRVGCLKPIPFIGGDESVKMSWKSALCLMYDAGIPFENDMVKAALKKGVHTHLSSSVGRLFDGVSAMLNVCTQGHYGGQPAIELENAAFYALKKENTPYPVEITLKNHLLSGDFAPCLREIHASPAPKEEKAYRFHVTVAAWIADMCERIGVKKVALGGGVFQNRLLLELVEPRLEEKGFTVYRNTLVPPGDGGISLGQMLVAQARLKGRK